jgi:hypothetical protein
MGVLWLILTETIWAASALRRRFRSHNYSESTQRGSQATATHFVQYFWPVNGGTSCLEDSSDAVYR